MVGDALAGSRGQGGRCTSVTAARMTDAYGVSTPAGVPRPPGALFCRTGRLQPAGGGIFAAASGDFEEELEYSELLVALANGR